MIEQTCEKPGFIRMKRKRTNNDLIKMGFKVNDRMGEIKTKLSKYPIHRKINRSDIIINVTNISTFLTLILAYLSMLSSLSNVSASHMSDEDNGKQN